MFQDNERALRIEKTAVASVRIDLVQLALWTEWMKRIESPVTSVNQAVSSALDFAVGVLRANGYIKGEMELGEAANWLDEHGLFQRRMLGKKKKKLGAYMSFENMRMKGENPRTSDRLTRQVYEKTHANDERTVLPLQTYDKIGVEIGHEPMNEEKKKIRTSTDWKTEELTTEDIERLKEIWIEMSEEEKFIVQKKIYRNNAAGMWERREWIIMNLYPRFRPIPVERIDISDEERDSDEYQKWLDDWRSKQDAFVRAISSTIPELIGFKKRLEFDESGEMEGERIVINVPSTGIGVITQKEYEAHIRQEEENKKNAMIQKEKEKLIRKEAERKAKNKLGIPKEEKKQINMEKEQERLQKRILKEEVKQRERLSKLEDKTNIVKDRLSSIKEKLESIDEEE